jgi:hypothetical protein
MICEQEVGANRLITSAKVEGIGRSGLWVSFNPHSLALAFGLWHHKVRETQVDVGRVPNRFSDSIPRFVRVSHHPVNSV